MRSQAIGFGLLVILAVTGCGNKDEKATTAAKVDGYWKVTSVTSAKTKKVEKVAFNMFLHLDNGKSRVFSSKEMNTDWVTDKDYTVTNDRMITKGANATEYTVKFNGDEMTMTAVKADDDIQAMVLKKISKEETDKVIIEAKKRPGMVPAEDVMPEGAPEGVTPVKPSAPGEVPTTSNKPDAPKETKVEAPKTPEAVKTDKAPEAPKADAPKTEDAPKA